MRCLSTNRESTRSILVSGLVMVLVLGGAVCSEAALIRVATSGSDVFGCGSESTPCRSLGYAVELAASNDEIRVAEGTYTGVSTGAGHTQLAWIRDKHITVRGGFTTSNWTTPNPAANPTVLDAQGLGMVLYISYSAIGWSRTSIEGFEITGGNATIAVSGKDEGGGVHVSHTVHMAVRLENCRIYGNTAEDGAGGVFSGNSGELELVDSIVEDNTGDGIRTFMADHVTVTGSTIRNHPGRGIGAFTTSGTTAITGSLITGNSPGIRLHTTEIGVISNNTISGNAVGIQEGGGGTWVTGSNDMMVSGNTFVDNEGSIGGAMYMTGCEAIVEDNLVVNNRAPFVSSSGGGGFAIEASNSHVEVNGNTLQSNSAWNQGGGMRLTGYIDATDNVLIGNTAYSAGGIIATITGTLEGNRFIGNSGQIGGGLSLINPMGVTLVRNLFRDNHATNGEGGGAYLWGGLFFDVPLLDGNRFINNTSTGSGGGLYMESQDDNATIVTNLLVQGNVAENHRSGMYQFGVTMDMSHSTFVDNVNTDGDGIGFYTSAFGDEGDVTMTNCIVAGQSTGIQVASGDVTIDHMLWGGGAWANDTDWTGGGVLASNEIWADPEFASTGGEGYHIDGNSPARDAGIDVGVLTDMDGEVRPNPDTGVPDLGADEWSDQFDIFADGFESGGTTAWD